MLKESHSIKQKLTDTTTVQLTDSLKENLKKYKMWNENKKRVGYKYR